MLGTRKNSVMPNNFSTTMVNALLPSATLYQHSTKLTYLPQSTASLIGFPRYKMASAKSSAAISPKMSELPSALRHYALMRFLQFPYAAKKFASGAVSMIQKGGVWKDVAVKVMSPVVKSFSAGDTIPEAVNTAKEFLQKDQQILLDYTEEMLDKSIERAAASQEISTLLDTVSATQLLYIPIKLTALIEPRILEKLSQGQELSGNEAQTLDDELLRLNQLVEKAEKLGKVIFIDQEYPHQKKAIFELALKLMERFNRNRPVVYITIQATDIDCFDLIKQLATNTAIHFPAIKLVNGAYVNWAHQHGYEKMIQPSKMSAFVAFALIAKYCLKNNIQLYMGTHNTILERVVDDAALALNTDKNKYLKGQLYGFTTKSVMPSMYSIFGPRTSCIHYLLRRVVEGAGSKAATQAPILGADQVASMVAKANLDISLSDSERELITEATRFNVQDVRVNIARENLRRFLPSNR